MTKLPTVNQDVVAVQGPAYQLNERCPVSNCEEFASERHHLWRRSFIIGDQWWVELPEGEVIGNCIGFCHYHHAMLTQNIASLIYDEGKFYFSLPNMARSELLWQPPFYTSKDSFYTERALGDFNPTAQISEHLGGLITEVEALKAERKTLPLDEEIIAERDRESGFTEFVGDPDLKTPGRKTGLILDGVCPTCERPLPRPKIDKPLEAKKLRKSWSVAVPVGEQENGAEVLDTLLEQARLAFARAGLPYGDEETAKYYPLATGLALFVTFAEELLSE